MPFLEDSVNLVANLSGHTVPVGNRGIMLHTGGETPVVLFRPAVKPSAALTAGVAAEEQVCAMAVFVLQ